MKTSYSAKSLLIFSCVLHFLCFSPKVFGQGFFLDNWQPKSITSPTYVVAAATTSTSTVTVTVDAASVVSKVSKYVFGHNAGVWDGKIEQNTSLMTDVTNLKTQIIRWPGGNMSNDYFWNASSQATCPSDLPSTFVFKDMLYGALKTSWTMPLDSYYDMLQKVNATGIICVNYAYARYGTSINPVAKAAHLAADWVRYDNGRTRYWEIGNENYGNWETGYTIDQSLNKDGQPATISGDLYGRHCKVFIDSMRVAANEVRNDIKIGVVTYDQFNTTNTVWKTWNQGHMPHIADKADYLVLHSYYTPYNENSNVATILNSATTKTKEIKDIALADLARYGNVASLPLALTEWNIFATGSKQSTSYINGMHATLVLGELIKNKFGQASRWDFLNGWDGGNSHGLFASGDYGMTNNTPRAPFHYMYYFQKFFGDNMVNSTVAGTDSVMSYASTFTSGQSGVVLVNKGKLQRTVNLRMNNFSIGKRYYYYLLTGGQDSTFSRKVFVNGQGPTQNGGGPANYNTLQPYGTDIINGNINLTLPKYSVLYVLVENANTTAVSTVQSNDATIRIYPNPASDFITIHVEGSEIPKIEIVDLHGSLLYQKKANQLTLNTRDLNFKGLCIVKVTGSNYLKTFKLLII